MVYVTAIDFSLLTFDSTIINWILNLFANVFLANRLKILN